MTRRTRAPLEADIQRTILQHAELQPDVMLVRQNTGAIKLEKRLIRFGTVGQADLTGCIRPSGRRLEIEVKRPGNKPTQAQQAWGERIRAAGGVYAVVHSLDEWIALLADLREEERKRRAA